MPVLPTSLLRWTPIDFARSISEGLVVDPASGVRLEPRAPEGVLVGKPAPAPTPFTEAIASWQAQAPEGTQIEVALRVEVDGRWTRWWTMGYWSSEPSRRFSVDAQEDELARVATDTLILRRPGQALQWRIVMRRDHDGASPTVRGLAVTVSPPVPRTPPDRVIAVPPLEVPQLSQMEIAVDGPRWCSAVSLTMVLQYWYLRSHDPQLAPLMAPDAAATVTAPAVHDPIWNGTGNWPFNTAFAASLGLEAYVARFNSLAELARWTAAGVPIIASINFEHGTLDNTPAGFEQSSGHLLVVVGFTPNGDVIVNEPRADPRQGEPVRRIYPRDQFKRAWHRNARGTVYLIYPGKSK